MAKKKSGGGGYVIAVVAGLFIAGQAHHPHHHAGSAGTATPAVADAVSGPSRISWAGGYSPYTWARAFLRGAHEPLTACNLGFVQAWERMEGGNWQNSARYNPINTTMTEPGSWSINSVGVKAYTSWHEGLVANVTTLYNGRYPGILSALRAGNSAQAAANAVGASPWGTGWFSAAC